ncbi:capsule assembly Wzi family protein [Christiangramia sp. SM2212]|uniref:Capsule assembly Wzi family protein n=1 Tax=Christiangramia sediminicola TaxID=3073267 RepID=A0ABU1ELX0_9FLAO|nr:capsule assembly Wzi family protein [Christiangramia sp. SM2212]MDR5589349.1 capsule assembly Wzi family protein [Christiangramia sp. SM2212]
MKIKFLVFVLIIWSQLSFGQFEFSGSATLEGYYTENEALPFWFYSNQRGRISENTNLAAWVNARTSYESSEKSSFEIGAGFFYNDNSSNKIYIDELYAQYNYKFLSLIAGSKHEKDLYNGLSASNENILWSLNSRAIPGFKIETSRPVYFSSQERLGLEFYWSESYLGDNPGAENVRLHHKQVQLLYNLNENWQFKASLRHFVQWGGISERFGTQPSGFTDYLKVITGRGGGENSIESDQANALGNHLGSWIFSVKRQGKNSSVKFLFNNLFEDGSGSRLANFPDGRYTFFYESSNSEKVINSLLYEFYYTKDQSKTGPHLYDNYFNNGVYPFGWTYKGRVIGSPFFTYHSEYNYIINNKFLAHHIGLSGQLSIFDNLIPYKFMVSYSNNEGLYSVPSGIDELNEDRLSYYAEVKVLRMPIQLNFLFGADFNSDSSNNIGAGISISKHF